VAHVLLPLNMRRISRKSMMSQPYRKFVCPVFCRSWLAERNDVTPLLWWASCAVGLRHEARTDTLVKLVTTSGQVVGIKTDDGQGHIWTDVAAMKRLSGVSTDSLDQASGGRVLTNDCCPTTTFVLQVTNCPWTAF